MSDTGLHADIQAAAQRHARAPANSVHRTKIELAKLVLSQVPGALPAVPPHP